MAEWWQHELIEPIHVSGVQLVLAVAGGGSGALAALMQVPGASDSVLEAVVPYSAAALADWLRGPPDQACSEHTARSMAMAAFERARLLTDANPRTLRGIGATASLATSRPKGGAHRVHVAWQSAEMTVAVSCELEKSRRSRAEEERLATLMVLEAVAEACGVGSGERGIGSRESLDMRRREQRAPAEWSELLLGERTMILHNAAELAAPPLLFPGAFHPLHDGHRRMIDVAERRCSRPVTLELSIANVDKPPLDFIELAERLDGLACRPVLVTRAATFVEKALLAPDSTFVVGADTIERIGDVRYYDGDVTRRDAAIAALAGHGCRFLVFGRCEGDRFRTLRDVIMPDNLRPLCDEVPESEFRTDICSTTLRIHDH